MNAEYVVIDTQQLLEDLAVLIDRGRDMRITVEGHSMSPFLAGGRDDVVLTAVRNRPLRTLDVCLYRRDDGRFVLHRLVKRRDGALYMMGDAETQREGPLREDQLRAVAVSIVRKGRTINADNAGWRLLSRLWLWLRPVRRPLLHLNWRLGRQKTRINGKGETT